LEAAPTIETERLLLRGFQDEDAPRLFAGFQDPVTSRFWFTPDRSVEESAARIDRNRKAWSEHAFGDWAVVEKTSGRYMGFCGLHFISGMREVNLGYLLAKEFWGRGYATEACRAAVRFGFETAALGLIIGVTHPDNGASIRVLKKCGMTYWKDVVRDGAPRVVYSASSPTAVLQGDQAPRGQS
jgi:ribosomal-protein-alanine N-acetyltransferase